MSIDEIIDHAVAENGHCDTALLRIMLLNREDGIADYIRLAGQQFGLHAEIVAAVLADTGLGTPLSDVEKALIRQQFIILMTRLRREFYEQNGEGE